MKINRAGAIACGIYAAISLPLVTLAHFTEAVRAAMLAPVSQPWASTFYVLSVALVYFAGWGVSSIRAIFDALNSYGPNWS